MSPVCGEGGGDVSITILASVVIGRDDARVLCRTGALPEIVQSDGKHNQAYLRRVDAPHTRM